MPDDALPDAVREVVRWHWDGPLPPEEVARDMQMADMLLLVGDRRRVWWRDLEGVFAGEDAYVSTLTEWAVISRGAFAPEEIVERWHSEDGPADIEFVVGGQRHRVAHPHLCDDFLNIAIISGINRLIGDSGYHFAVCDNLGMPKAGWSRSRARRRTGSGKSGAGSSSRCEGPVQVPTRTGVHTFGGTWSLCLAPSVDAQLLDKCLVHLPHRIAVEAGVVPAELSGKVVLYDDEEGAK